MFIVSAAGFYFSEKTIKETITDIKKTDVKIKRQQEILNSAKVLNEELREVSKVIMNTMTSAKSFSPDEVNALVKRLADLADTYEIPVQSVVPKFIDAGGKFLIEQQYTIELECTYIQLGKFLTDMEAYENIVKIKTLEVRPSMTDKNMEEAKEMRYKITLQLSTLKIVKEA
jgi:Tfp pilus assembly protein PilO